MDTPQIIILACGCLTLLTAIVFYSNAKNIAGTSTISFAFLMILVGGVGPTTIKDMIFKQSDDGFEFRISRNIDTPEKIKLAIDVDSEIDKGITSNKSVKLVKETKDTPDARRSAADYLILATDNWKSGNYIEGIAFAQQGLRLDPKDIRLKATLLHRMGALLGSIGDKAEEFYYKSIEVDSEFSWPYINLGDLYWNLKRYDEAETAFRKALELDPEDGDAHNGLGNLFSELERYDEAEIAYRKALELDPKFVYAHNGLGNVLTDLERYDEAETAYRKALELDPEYGDAYHGLGNVHRDLERYDEAETAYRKALDLDPEYVYAYHGLGNVLSDLERYDEAETAYRKALDLDPEFVYAHNGLGDVLWELERYDEAETAYNKALVLDPNNSIVKNNLKRLHDKKVGSRS
jgi:tetratricopeptide (TPR) repeat protein